MGTGTGHREASGTIGALLSATSLLSVVTRSPFLALPCSKSPRLPAEPLSLFMHRIEIVHSSPIALFSSSGQNLSHFVEDRKFDWSLAR